MRKREDGHGPARHPERIAALFRAVGKDTVSGFRSVKTD
jgi:hypothetical protein